MRAVVHGVLSRMASRTRLAFCIVIEAAGLANELSVHAFSAGRTFPVVLEPAVFGDPLVGIARLAIRTNVVGNSVITESGHKFARWTSGTFSFLAHSVVKAAAWSCYHHT